MQANSKVLPGDSASAFFHFVIIFFSCCLWSDSFVITINARKAIDLPFFTQFMGLSRVALIVVIFGFC